MSALKPWIQKKQKTLRERLRICSWVNEAAEILLASPSLETLQKVERLIKAEEDSRPLPGNEDRWLKIAGRFFVEFVASTYTRLGPQRGGYVDRPINELALASLALEKELGTDPVSVKGRRHLLERLAANDRLSDEIQNEAKRVLDARISGQAKPSTFPRNRGRLLRGWKQICQVLKQKTEFDSNSRVLKRLSKTQGGPIRSLGKGRLPEVFQDDLLNWFSDQEGRLNALREKSRSTRASLQEATPYGRSGEKVFHQIRGHEKRRRKDLGKKRKDKQ